MTPDVVCDRCRDQLIDYAAGTLPEEARDLLARHLESCSACTRELEQWQEIGVAVRGAPVPLPSEPFAIAWRNLQAQLDAVPSRAETKAVTHWVEAAAKPWPPQYLLRSTGGRMRVLGACAAVLALVVVSAAVFATLAIHRSPLASGTATPQSSATTSPTSVPTPPLDHSAAWHIVASPVDRSADAWDELTAVAAVSASDVWAVGNLSFEYHGTLIEHWNGTSWSLVPHPYTSPPSATSFSDSLFGVAAVSANDVWAVGSYIPAADQQGYGAISHTLIEHWNGNRWSIVPSPNLGIGTNQLNAVAAVSADDVWAVGYAGNETLVELWNGSSWSIVPSPSTVTPALLNGVTAISAEDIWAVGGVNYTSWQSDTLIEHWNGSSWSMVPSPDEFPVPHSGDPYTLAFNVLNAVSAASADDIWAVGYAHRIASHTLVEHWNGSRWSIVSTPAIAYNNPYSDPDSGTGSGFRDVVAISADEVWVVGTGYLASGSSNTLIEHWNGSGWSIVPHPEGQFGQNWLYGVAAASAGDIWAVGSYQPGHVRVMQGFVVQGT